MSPFLGIDHPLVVVNDLTATAERYEALGFFVRPQGKHPWGTSMRVVSFDKCSIELMGVYDESLLDENAVDGFSFGRFIRDQLREREGISLLALNSSDGEGDAAQVAARGINIAGTIYFGRDVKREDGTPDRTKTTLKILKDPELPRLANFIVHQHRPDLIFKPEWGVHPNGATGIHQVTIMAEEADWPQVRRRLAGMYGEAEVYDQADGFGAHTGNGDFVVMTKAEVATRYGTLPPSLASEARPSCVAIHVTVPDIEKAQGFVDSAGANHARGDGEIILSDATAYGNIFLTLATPRQR